MFDFQFHNPTRIVFGKKTDAAHGMTQLGERRDVTLEVSRRVLELSL